MKLKVLVGGAGAIGCYTGAHLLKAGCDVVFLGRASIGE
ncbi:MAG: 2-dehydropantoate 2-reductase N-terminal domain-containing protein, partial [Bdellovibrionia bacterium]